ncbi:MAG: cysteine desulfurase NifS [Pedosphaera sp. Tous-C6FEB]|nr:MAG: cysteine desulfurase NifS [Pedosphaera sp. Tous-C6FEB]
MKRAIYFDYNATTPLDPQVRAAMLPFFDEVWGNPSSIHQIGRRARALLDDARDRVGAALGCKSSEVVFTSGGTESSNLAVFGTARLLRDKGRHLITSSVEHHAVLHCFDYLECKEGFAVTRLPVDAAGRVGVEDFRRALRPDTVLASVMAANNETGTLQPVAEIGALCRERGVIFHTDAVQVLGKQPFADIHEFNADLVSICAHKLHGPKGAGALFIRSPLHPDPVQFGGAHENERRAGTENLPAIIGLTEALERFIRVPVFEAARLAPLTERLLATVQTLEGVHFRGSATARLANTLAFTVAGTDSIALLAALDMEGVCASSGSACSAGSLEPSHVMLAMGAPKAEANALVRLSLGRDTTPAEVETVAALLPGVIRQVQRRTI